MNQAVPLSIGIMRTLMKKIEKFEEPELHVEVLLIRAILQNVSMWVFYAFQSCMPISLWLATHDLAPKWRTHILTENIIQNLLEYAKEDLHLYRDLPHDENHELSVTKTETEETYDKKKIVKTSYTYGHKAREKKKLVSFSVPLSNHALALHLY